MKIYQRIPVVFYPNKEEYPEQVYDGEFFLIQGKKYSVLYLNNDFYSGGHKEDLKAIKEITNVKFKYLWWCIYTKLKHLDLSKEFNGFYFKKFINEGNIIDSAVRNWYFVLKEKPSEKFKEINL